MLPSPWRPQAPSGAALAWGAVDSVMNRVVEAFTPNEIARRVETAGTARTYLGIFSTLGLAIMAGVFIGLGGSLTGTIAVDSGLGAGPTRLLMGLGLSMGLFMVIITGAELFTGNNLMLMSLLSRRIRLLALGRNWLLAYVGNLVGALLIVTLVFYGRWWAQGDFSFGATALDIADAKVNLSFEAAFLRGILANMLVCLAIWMAMAGRTVVDKLLGITLPITAFVAAGFEHSIANMYFLPLGLLVAEEPQVLAAAGVAAGDLDRLTLPWVVHNLAAVTLGNIVGGALIGLIHWFLHLRSQRGEEG